MKLKLLSGENMYYGFISGANEVIKQKIELNRINVFPVADGDTGSNLAYTMNTIIQNTQIKDSPKETMKLIAEASLVGARGNSGIIFAQFINGMYMEMVSDKDIDVASFSNSVSKAVSYAYEAISIPVEGTIITVMKDWADSLKSLSEREVDFNLLFTDSLKVAMESLLDTPNKLQILKDNNVVDSGAKGFVHFIEGFLKFLKTGEVEKYSDVWEKLTLDNEEIHFHSDLDLENRYCTEALVEGKDLDLEKIRKELKIFGESLIVAGNKSKMRIHIHVINPEAFFNKLNDYGKIVFQKVDDMKRQYETLYSKNSEIALVTDSIADLPQSLMDKYQVHLFPLNLLINDSNYLDKLSITPEYFYDLMDTAETYPSSSQPTSYDIENFLKSIVDHYEKIIVVTVSKEMSGTFNTFEKVIKNLNIDENKIKVINSKLNSGAQGLVVLKAAEEIASGKTFEEVIESVENIIERTEIFVSVPTLEYMYKSGRIGKAQQIALNMINLKPVVSIDEKGDGIIIGKAFSVNGNTKKIAELVKDIMKDNEIERYSLVHARAGERLGAYKEYYKDLIGFEPEYIMEISPVVALNAGIGCVAISLTYKKRRE